jgi:hypothetical protein
MEHKDGNNMKDDFEVRETGEEHKMIVDPVGFISEIINNISDQRDIIRELLSNASAKEVGAKKVDIKIYESDRGLAFTVVDDGHGMNYTKSEKNPGRLDKFLNAAQGKQAGFESDEFGAKGLGTKLLYNSDRVEIETWDGRENCYRVILNEPRKSIVEDKKLASPLVTVISAEKNPLKKRGTSITVKGWSGSLTVTKDYKLERIEKYLRYYSVLGYTKMEQRDTPFPVFNVWVGGLHKELDAGFPFIIADGKSEDVKTVTFGPIIKKKTTDSGKNVKIVLKGGVTTDTGKFHLTEDTGGVWLSVNGIPYFKLSKNKYAKKINLTDDFIRFVVECEDINLNLSRSDFSYDEKYEAFEDVLSDAFNEIKDDSKYQKFYKNKYKQLKIEMQVAMNEKKQEFQSEEKRYVWYKDRMVLAEPESEYDTAALLWILEGAGAMPFTKFKTLQYPGYREGIDLLVNFQEEDDKEEHICSYAELERFFSSFIKHKHDIGQMTLAFCWKLDKSKINLGKIEATRKPFKYIYSFGDTTIPVFEISNFTDIFTGTKKEAKLRFEVK